MIKQIANWQGKVNVNGIEYQSISDVPKNIPIDSSMVITLIPRVLEHTDAKPTVPVIDHNEPIEHTITVKAYMTRKASPDFDFMEKWNNNIPMPMRKMTGVILKETRGMVRMRLHGCAERTINCSICQRELTNPVSRYYGIGPICLAKLGISRDIDDVSGITEDLVNLKWEGWVIKSAITNDEVKEAS